VVLTNLLIQLWCFLRAFTGCPSSSQHQRCAGYQQHQASYPDIAEDTLSSCEGLWFIHLRPHARASQWLLLLLMKGT